MKIHIFIAHMGIGGSERVCVNLANEWAKKHEVHIVVLNLNNDVNTHLLDRSVKVHELGVSRLRYAALPMLRYIRRNKPSFMFIFGMEMAIILNKLKKLRLVDTKLVVRILNNVNISLAKEDNVSPVVENYLKKSQIQMQDMDVVIAQCKAMGKMLVDSKVVSDDKLKVIYNPVSSDLISKVDVLRKGNKAQGNRITFIGRIDPQKQPDHLIRVFEKIKKELPEAVLRLVGDGNLIEQTKKLVSDLHLDGSVIFDGIRKDMENVYADCDVVVLTSQYEGMPNALIEAVGCGIPVISYDCPIGPSEIIEDGVNGFLIDQDDTDEFAKKTVIALKQSWDEDIIKATCKKFDAQVIAKQYEEIFASL